MCSIIGHVLHFSLSDLMELELDEFAEYFEHAEDILKNMVAKNVL